MKNFPLKTVTFGVALFSLTALAFAQGQGGMKGHGRNMMGADRSAMMENRNPATMARHQDFSRGGISPQYQGAKPSAPLNAATLAQGQAIYMENCATCHGTTGKGDGEAADGLNPRPLNLTVMPYTQMQMDGLLFYTVSEGGEKYGSDMPSFKDALSEQERWAVVGYVKQGLIK